MASPSILAQPTIYSPGMLLNVRQTESLRARFRRAGSSPKADAHVRPSRALPHCSLLENDAAFHHERHLLESSNVFERISGNGDDIGVIASLECADLSVP